MDLEKARDTYRRAFGHGHFGLFLACTNPPPRRRARDAGVGTRCPRRRLWAGTAAAEYLEPPPLLLNEVGALAGLGDVGPSMQRRSRRDGGPIQEGVAPAPRLLFIGVVQSCRNLKIDSERQSKVQELSHIFLAEALPGAGERTSVGGAEPVSARWGRGAYLHCLMTFCHYILYTI